MMALIGSSATAQDAGLAVPEPPPAADTSRPVQEAATTSATDAAGQATGAAPTADDEVRGSADEGDDWLSHLQVRVFVDAFVASHWTLQNGFQGDHSGCA